MKVQIYLRLSSLLLLLFVKSYVEAQVALPGKCPDVNIVENFQLNAFMGQWYEYSKYPFLVVVGMDCSSMEYKNLGNNTMSMTSGAISQFTHTFTSLTGYAKILGPARFLVNYNRSNKKKQLSGNRENYVIIGTDYTTYALVLSCYDFRDIYHHEVVWILTRVRKPSKETIKKAKDLMNQNGLSQRYLLETEQDDCPSTW